MSRLSRPGIHLIGAAVTVGVLGAGLLTALPLASQAMSAASDADRIVHTNGLQQVEVDALSVQSARMTELADAIEALRVQIPTQPLPSDLSGLLAAAESASGSTVTLVDVAPVMPFAPRTPEIAAASAASMSGEAGIPAAAPPPAPEDPRQQQTATIALIAPDARATAVFADTLRLGPRAVAIDSIRTDRVSDGLAVTMTVVLFADTTGAEG